MTPHKPTTVTKTDPTAPVIRAAVVDDEAPARRLLRKLLSRYCPGVLVVGEAADAAGAEAMLASTRADLLFLDIQLGGASGFSLLERLPETPPFVVFVTAHDTFAVEAFRASAIDYLVKPIVIEQLEDAVARVRRQLSGRIPAAEPSVGARLVVRHREERRVIRGEDIVHVRAEGSYSHVALVSGEVLFVVRKLGSVEEELASGAFFRTHRSHLVNLTHAVAVHRSEVELRDGRRVPITRGRANEVVDALRGLG